jgi:hypothetical protein
VRSFFDSDRAAVLNVCARLVIGFVEQNIVELPLIDHRSALAALVEMPFLRFAQLVKIIVIHSWDGTRLAFAPQGRFRCPWTVSDSQAQMCLNVAWERVALGRNPSEPCEKFRVRPNFEVFCNRGLQPLFQTIVWQQLPALHGAERRVLGAPCLFINTGPGYSPRLIPGPAVSCQTSRKSPARSCVSITLPAAS